MAHTPGYSQASADPRLPQPPCLLPLANLSSNENQMPSSMLKSPQIKETLNDILFNKIYGKQQG